MLEDKFYLTKQGLAKIRKEYEDLLLLKQEKVHNETPVVFHSEELDTEFVAFKEEIEFLEAREADLEYILKNAVLIERPSEKEQGEVGLGANVLVDVNGKEDEFVIVGTLEANPAEGKISDESPVGKAFLGRKVGDEILISSPTTIAFKIKRISY